MTTHTERRAQQTRWMKENMVSLTGWRLKESGHYCVWHENPFVDHPTHFIDKKEFLTRDPVTEFYLSFDKPWLLFVIPKSHLRRNQKKGVRKDKLDQVIKEGRLFYHKK